MLPPLLQAERLFAAKWPKWAAQRRRRPQAAAAAELGAEEALAAALEGRQGLGREAREFVEGAADLAYARGIAGENRRMVVGLGWGPVYMGLRGTPPAVDWCVFAGLPLPHSGGRDTAHLASSLSKHATCLGALQLSAREGS